FEAPEHQRIAGLQSDDAAPCLRMGNHQIVDVALLAGASITLLADIYALDLRGGDGQNLRRYELIVENDVRALKRPCSLERQKLRITWSGPHETDRTTFSFTPGCSNLGPLR